MESSQPNSTTPPPEQPAPPRLHHRLGQFVWAELLGRFVGFVAGLGTSYLLGRLFVRKSVFNLWGVASRRTALDKDTLNLLEIILTTLAGFIVMELLTRALASPRVRGLINKKR